jgi:hypothetical protein
MSGIFDFASVFPALQKKPYSSFRHFAFRKQRILRHRTQDKRAGESAAGFFFS